MISDTEWWITGGTGWTDPWPHYMTTDVITFTGAGNASVAPGNNLPVARISHCIVKVADQEYFLGGGTSVGYFDDKAWYTLDLGLNWVDVSPMPGARSVEADSLRKKMCAYFSYLTQKG